MTGGAKSLYVHFPYCRSKCHYCDFYSLGQNSLSGATVTHYQTTLKAEFQGRSSLLAPKLETIYFGGGTPSLLSAAQWSEALDLQKYLTPETEWTLEANPGSAPLKTLKERFEGYRQLGINRLSIGIQSLQPHLLARLGRCHSPEEAIQAVEAAYTTGFRNISVDLMCGIPGQTEDELKKDLKALIELPITHLSCYLLTLSPGNRLFSALPDEETQLQHLLLLDQEMRNHGYRHYEISNFAKSGHLAKHNLNYWKRGSYLGLGPSAHSFDARLNQRSKNSLEGGIEWTETLTPEQRELERWMLALRLDEGFPMTWLVSSAQKQQALELQTKGLLERHPELPDQLRLTPRGFALSDQIIEKLI